MRKNGGPTAKIDKAHLFCVALLPIGLGRQYIDSMLFTRRFAPLLQRCPGTCQVCARWPAQPICQHCTTRFGAAQARCTTCARPLHGARTRCGACLTDRHPSALEVCLAAVDYAYPWDNLIARFKFRNEPALAQPLASLMLRQPAVSELLQSCDWLIPMPVTPARLAERGCNQAWELAKALRKLAEPGGAAGLPSGSIRIGHAPDQHNLPAEQRVKNLKGTFIADPEQVRHLQGSRVLLVDDVSTTGATLRAPAQALRHAGASRVSAPVLARTAAG
jgi:ComF family protein